MSFGRVHYAKPGMLTGSFPRLINDLKVEENGGDILYLVVRVRRVVRFAGSADEPPLRGLSHLNGFGIEVLFVDLDDLNAGCIARVKGFEEGLTHAVGVVAWVTLGWISKEGQGKASGSHDKEY